MIVPSAEPVTGTTLTSMSGTGASCPGSGMFVSTFGDAALDAEAEIGAARGGETYRLALRERRPQTATDPGLRLEVGLEQRGAGHDRVGVGRHHAYARPRPPARPASPACG